jgi:hypothetical protein
MYRKAQSTPAYNRPQAAHSLNMNSRNPSVTAAAIVSTQGFSLEQFRLCFAVPSARSKLQS